MHCPKCRGAMLPVTHAGITVDRCAACGGLWFDGVEHLELRKIADAAVIDPEANGSAAEGKNTELPIVRCPVCGAPMRVRFDAYQHHIHYETCPHAHGAYFDAGEFRDFVTDDWSDFFKGLFTSYPRN